MILPCIGNISYWIKVVHNEQLVLETNHTFQKQTELSQFEIVGPNGRMKLSIPTVKSTRRKSYAEVLIDHSSPWAVEHWRSIENAYRKSPFFLYYGYKIEPIFSKRYTYLLDFNIALMETIVQCIRWPMPSINTSQSMAFEPTTKQEHKEYPQVFDHRLKFEANLCVLDLLFNLGPETYDYLSSESVS